MRTRISLIKLSSSSYTLRIWVCTLIMFLLLCCFCNKAGAVIRTTQIRSDDILSPNTGGK